LLYRTLERPLLFYLADEGSSELSEILRVLEVAAASNVAIAGSKRAAQPSGIVLPAAAMASELPASAAVVTNPPAAAAGRAAAPSAGERGGEARTAPAAAIPQPPVFVPSVDSEQGKAREKEQYDRSRRGANPPARAPARSSAGTESKEDGNDSDASQSDRDEGVGSSYCEDEWKAMRNKQKKTADRVVETRPGSGAPLVPVPPLAHLRRAPVLPLLSRMSYLTRGSVRCEGGQRGGVEGDGGGVRERRRGDTCASCGGYFAAEGRSIGQIRLSCGG
jgi:hypothetical protein